MTETSYEKQVRAWCLYDWANSAFYTTLMAAVVPLFFRNVAAARLPESQKFLATSLWGYTAAAAMFCVTVLSLVLGPFADYSHSKKRFLAAFTITGALASGLLVLTGVGDWMWVSLLFILANIGAAGGEAFYDALLPHLARPGDINRISTQAYAWGYLGGGLLLAVNLGMIFLLPKKILIPGHDPVPLLGMQLSFLSVGLWWGVFAVPLFRHIPEPGGSRPVRPANPLTVSVRRLSATFHDIRQYRPLFLFILAFWFYNDGIGTIMKMAIAYGDEIGIGTMDLIGALMLTQVLGVPCSLLFGRAAGRFGARQMVLAGLFVYILACLGGFFISAAWHFWALAFMVGLVMGGTQALSRSIYAAMVPKEKSAEFFSFYTISGKFAGVSGPAIFGLTGQLFGTGRWGILSLVFFFVAGGILLTRVKLEQS